MEFKLRKSKRLGSSGTGSTKSSSRLPRPFSSSSGKVDDVERLRRKNHDHFTSHTLLRSSDPRIQPMALASGHRKYAHTYPPRGTLDDEKLEYLTWRMHMLFAVQTRSDDESSLLLEQDSVSGTQIGTVEVTTITKNRASSASTYSASMQSTSSSSSNSAAHQVEDGTHAIVAMHRDVEPGWIDSRSATAMTEMMSEAKDALKHALMNDNAMAAIPLLEHDQRMFSVDRHKRCKEARNGSADSSSIEEEAQLADDTLPPPLMPASMFYRASFGIRTKPSRTTSAQSVPKSIQATQKNSLPTSPSMSKLRSIFRLQPRRSHSEGPGTLYTLGQAP